MVVSLIALIVFIICGWKRPSNLVLLLIWTEPYLAGNALFGWVPSFEFQPSISIGFAIIAIAFLKQRLFKQKSSFAESIYLLLFYILLTTVAVGLFYKFEFLRVWNQPPLIRGVRSYLNELFFWITPLAALSLGWREKNINQYGRAFIHAGFFYCGLGILQFLVSLSFGIDIFSVIRRGVTVVLQPLALGGLSGRITSICGEPRYLAAYAVFWFTLLLCTGKYFGFKPRIQVFGCLFFLITALLSGSKTTIFSTGIVITFIVLFQTIGLGKFIQKQQLILLFSSGLLAAIMKFALWNNSADLDKLSIVTRVGKIVKEQPNLNLGFIHIPLEYQDLEALKVVWETPWMLITGSGVGLWQYGFNPFSIDTVKATYTNMGIHALNSVQSNIGLIHNLVNYGTIGILVIVLIYFNFFRLCAQGTSQQDRKQLLGLMLIFLLFAQFIRSSSGFYAQLALILLLCSIRLKIFQQEFYSSKINNIINI